VVMRFAVRNLERDRDLRKERLEGQRLEIRPRLEAQPINTWRRRAGIRHQRPLPSIGIRFSPPDDLPFRFLLSLENDAHAGGRDATGGIEDVGSDRAHDESILTRVRGQIMQTTSLGSALLIFSPGVSTTIVPTIRSGIGPPRTPPPPATSSSGPSPSIACPRTA
jgi:hypothetical protein